MKETAVTFGAHGGLVGVITEPTAGKDNVRRAVIVSNIGMHHRVGPYRIWVELARTLAASGITVLRFDLSGMGDSAQRSDAATPADRADRDLDDAMALLTERLGITEFILIGLCSGVDSTHSTAVRSAQVIGAAFIDGYSYPTTGYYVRHYLVRPLQLGRWISYVKRRVLEKEPEAVASEGPAVFVRQGLLVGGAVREHVTCAPWLIVGHDCSSSTPAPGRAPSTRRGSCSRHSAAASPPSTLQELPRRCYEADHVFTSVARRADLIRRLGALGRLDPGDSARSVSCDIARPMSR
ncbi:MAG: hypothetical protein U5K74_05020 [Gemmatimonadaceae bacterium]|nr:hypothetical protein [Gemmatimonadaceae bacterium]